MSEEKPYKVGISTGFWYIGKDPALLGLATKIGGLGATAGVQFVQIDLETVAEFQEPGVVNGVKQMMKKLNITDVGLHGEIGEVMSVDCAEKKVWEQTHERLVQAVRYAAQLGFKYVNVHFSFKPVLSYTESQQRLQGYFYPVCAPDGRALQDYVKGNKEAEKEATRHLKEGVIVRSKTGQEELRKLKEQVYKDLEKELDEEFNRLVAKNPDASEKEKSDAYERMRANMLSKSNVNAEVNRRVEETDFVEKIWLKMKKDEFERYLLDDGEFGAFFTIAHYMKATNDYLWSKIANGQEPDALYEDDENAFCAAVASKYLEGHVTTKTHASNDHHLDGMSIREWCEKHKLYLLFENPEANRGQEGRNRLFHPKHYYHTIKNIGSPYVKICLDVEHMVSHGLDPDKVLPEMPGDFGKQMVLWHLGQPVPYGGTSHIPIPRGSIAQEQIYKWIYWIKKKGFNKGYILFERGGGRSGSGRQNYEVFEDSVQALKQIAHYLEKDTHPDHLPPEFYGIAAGNKGVWARQMVTMREHAWDPLDGLLSVPEEKHTFFGRAAVEKGKAQEWEKRKFR